MRFITLIVVFFLSLSCDIYAKGSNTVNWDLHHIFPQQHIEYFKLHNINIHKKTIILKNMQHRRTVHGKKYRYNARWDDFIKFNKNVNEADLYDFASSLLNEAGVQGNKRFYDYNTGKLSEGTLKIDRNIQRLAKKLGVKKIIKVVDKNVFVKMAQKSAIQVLRVIPGLGIMMNVAEIVYFVAESNPEETQMILNSIGELACGAPNENTFTGCVEKRVTFLSKFYDPFGIQAATRCAIYPDDTDFEKSLKLEEIREWFNINIDRPLASIQVHCVMKEYMQKK